MGKKIAVLFFLLLEIGLLEASFVSYHEVSILLDKNFSLISCLVLQGKSYLPLSEDDHVPPVVKKYCLGTDHEEAKKRFESAKKNKNLGLPDSQVLRAWWLDKYKKIQKKKKFLREEIESRQRRLSTLEETGVDPGESSEEDWSEEEAEDEIRVPDLEEIVKEYKKTEIYKKARRRTLQSVGLVDFSKQKIFLNEMIYDEKLSLYLSFKQLQNKTRFSIHRNKQDRVNFFKTQPEVRVLSHRKVKAHLRRLGIARPEKEKEEKEEETCSHLLYALPSVFVGTETSSNNLDLVLESHVSF